MVDRAYHHLLQTCLVVSLPKVVLRDGFKGSWRHDIDRALFSEVGLHSGETLLQKFTPETARLMTRIFPAGFRYLWRDRNTVVINIPWYFSERAERAVPLYYAGEGSEFYHTVSTLTELKDMYVIESAPGEDKSFETAVESLHGELSFHFESKYAELTDMEVAGKTGLTNHSLDKFVVRQPYVAKVETGKPVELPEGHYSHLFWWTIGGEIITTKMWDEEYSDYQTRSDSPFSYLAEGSPQLHYWSARVPGGDPLYESCDRHIKADSLEVNGTGTIYVVGMKTSIIQITPSAVRVKS